MAFEVGFNAEALLERMLRVVFDKIQKCALLPALRRVDSTLCARGRSGFFQELAVFEINRHVNRLGRYSASI